ncbi:hypothetical protein HDV05_000316, partial [Chytridiales sp. JEL 0842]
MNPLQITPSIRPYVARYVWDTLRDDTKRDLVMESLAMGRAYTEDAWMAVAIIDISGYSKITSDLSTLGNHNMASEIVTQTLNKFFRSIINVITGYGGDICRFLGDAVLVSFSFIHPLETPASIAARALACCVYITKHHNEIKVDLSQIGPQPSSTSQLRSPNTPTDTNTNTNTDVITLSLHTALAAGNATRYILGHPDTRLDYVIQSPTCLSNLGTVLDGTGLGEVGFTEGFFEVLPRQVKDVLPKERFEGGQRSFLQGGEQEEEGGGYRRLKRGEVGELEGFMAGLGFVQRREDAVEDDEEGEGCGEVVLKVVSKFVNKALLYKTFQQQTMVAPAANEEEEEQDCTTLPFAAEDSSSKIQTPKIIKSRPVTIKGVPTTEDQDNFRSEFRKVTVIFVKLDPSTTADLANTILVLFLKQVDKFHGVFQQFSVDDKGATMLACFGLPPWTTEKDTSHALKAAISFKDALRSRQVARIAISVATGDLLFTKLGNRHRCDASLLGDCVNVAARLLKIAAAGGEDGGEAAGGGGMVCCDDATFQAGKHDFQMCDLGAFKVKGKNHPINVWSVDSKHSQIDGPQVVKSVGYNTQKQTFAHRFGLWHEANIKLIMIVEGLSGMGKSNMVDYALSLIGNKGLAC